VVEYSSQLKLIREAAEKEKIAFKKHSVLRMYERGIRADEVKEVLTSGEIIESYPEDKPLPSYLLLGYTSKIRNVHVVVAVDKNEPMLWIITVYLPTTGEWDEEFRKRK
jgi:hypothetical protein